MNFFLMDTLKKEGTLAKGHLIKIKPENICYRDRLGRNNGVINEEELSKNPSGSRNALLRTPRNF